MEIKVISYNIDALPEQLDLNDLPWILKPIAWIYKLFKGTTVIRVNDNHDVDRNIFGISNYLSTTGVNIIGVQEDFNYHKTLMQCLGDYSSSTFTGKIDFSDIWHSIKWFPYPRFKADGLNLIAKKEGVEVISEDIVKWKRSYGYFSHANDKLTCKGFRAYTVTVSGIGVDVYLLHMDADFYDPDTCPNVKGDIKARKAQLQQLSQYIIDRYPVRPSIIIGDTNSTEKYEWDTENINEYLLKPINATDTLSIQEAVPSNYIDVDRVFYINSSAAINHISASECYYDLGQNWSDHFPLVVKFEVK